jgi:endoglucanase
MSLIIRTKVAGTRARHGHDTFVASEPDTVGENGSAFRAIGLRRTAAVHVALLTAAVLIWSHICFAIPPAERIAALSRGINITGWFRYPVSRDPAALRAWLGDEALTDLKRAGFTFVRLAVDPALLDSAQPRRVFIDQIRRMQNQGLAVVISPHAVSWSMPADRTRLIAFWRDLAPELRRLTPAMTFPEVLNEPVFRDNPAAWWDLQGELHAVIRAALPDATIILTGHDWGSIGGLLALTPIADGNVVYSFHFYDPAELTSLAAYRPGLDRSALARLPFPETSVAECDSVADTTSDQASHDLIRFYCATGWDAGRVRSRILEAADWARRHGVVLLAGEFGASAMLNRVSRIAWLRLVRETCASNGIGWALWGYDDVMGFNVARPPGNSPVLDRSVLGALGLSGPVR